ncbi:hypothetical protein BN12_40034 [Nostocoides japonicum T1-X7]|uniref:Uncharacterized protein n=2 Tax=Nostocoides japonicum TaxID=99481 RepID=A0A077M4L5_9MICO|nr:hypothetical protein BN12_40034 [Tetrasphaera japonica T1-X7]
MVWKLIGGQRVGTMRRARAPEVAGELGRISRRDLERRWMRTSDLIAGGHLPAERLSRLAGERAALLDELERRDPDTVAGLLAVWAHTSPPPTRSGRHVRARSRRLER